MAQHKKRVDYRKKYPSVNDEIVKVLEDSDLQMEYQERDLKVDHYKVSKKDKTLKRYPALEQSYEGLLEADKQFQAASENPEDIVEKRILIEKMMSYVKTLPKDEQELIQELFFNGKSEYTLSAETGVPRMTIHCRKDKILKKIRKMFDK